MFKRLIIILGIFAQFAVPTWLIAKQQLILRHGEEVDVKVNVYDPRDFLAGHYVQLSPSGDIPAALENVPTDYLRYYCDQRYAKGIEELVRKQNQKAVLSVRVWQGQALASNLLIGGIPAFAAVRKGRLPDEARPIQMAYNYCTLSYTMALWGKKEWKAELTRLRDTGFTHVLVNAGMEEVWYDFLTKIGYASPEKFIPHPAWRAWWLMGNLEGTGGPLSVKERQAQADIGRFIVDFCLKNGMTPVLPSFTGMMPSDFAEVKPQGRWAGGYQRPGQFPPTHPNFNNLAKSYYECLFSVYDLSPARNQRGTLAFAGDLFHEGGSAAGLDVTACTKAVQAAQQAAFPKAVWFVQAWGGNPTAQMLAGLDSKTTCIEWLDKNFSDKPLSPPDYKGIPWIWCEVSNFGDNPNLYGGPGRIEHAKTVIDAKTNHCNGWGMLSEGIQQNPFFYETLLHRLGEGKKPRDFGKAMEPLLKSVYLPLREQEGCTEGILCARPRQGVVKTSTWSSGNDYYDKNLVRQSAEILLGELRTNPALLNDCQWRDFTCDVLRQVLCDRFTQTKNVAIFDLMDKLLLNSEKMSLYRFYTMANSMADYRKYLRLITTWATTITELNDYSHRQLGGLMVPYYKQRWVLFQAGKNQNEISAFECAWAENAPIPPKPKLLSVKEFITLGEQIMAQ